MTLFLSILKYTLSSNSKNGTKALQNSSDIASPIKLSDLNVPLKLEDYTRHHAKSMNYLDLMKLADKNYPQFISCIKNSPHGQGQTIFIQMNLFDSAGYTLLNNYIDYILIAFTCLNQAQLQL